MSFVFSAIRISATTVILGSASLSFRLCSKICTAVFLPLSLPSRLLRCTAPRSPFNRANPHRDPTPSLSRPPVPDGAVHNQSSAPTSPKVAAEASPSKQPSTLPPTNTRRGRSLSLGSSLPVSSPPFSGQQGSYRRSLSSSYVSLLLTANDPSRREYPESSSSSPSAALNHDVDSNSSDHSGLLLASEVATGITDATPTGSIIASEALSTKEPSTPAYTSTRRGRSLSVGASFSVRLPPISGKQGPRRRSLSASYISPSLCASDLSVASPLFSPSTSQELYFDMPMRRTRKRRRHRRGGRKTKGKGKKKWQASPEQLGWDPRPLRVRILCGVPY